MNFDCIATHVELCARPQSTTEFLQTTNVATPFAQYNGAGCSLDLVAGDRI